MQPSVQKSSRTARPLSSWSVSGRSTLNQVTPVGMEGAGSLPAQDLRGPESATSEPPSGGGEFDSSLEKENANQATATTRHTRMIKSAVERRVIRRWDTIEG